MGCKHPAKFIRMDLGGAKFCGHHKHSDGQYLKVMERKEGSVKTLKRTQAAFGSRGRASARWSGWRTEAPELNGPVITRKLEEQ